MKHSRTLPVPGHYRVLFEAGSFSGLSDGELLAHFVNRESDAAELAFAALVERHASMVLCTCRSVVGNEHDAEDAFQATFLILATKAGGLRVRESLGPWLSAVAHRVSRGARAVALARAARELRAAQLAAEQIQDPNAAAKSRQSCTRRSTAFPSDTGFRSCSATCKAARIMKLPDDSDGRWER